jgi:hypothetical protein
MYRILGFKRLVSRDGNFWMKACKIKVRLLSWHDLYAALIKVLTAIMLRISPEALKLLKTLTKDRL